MEKKDIIEQLKKQGAKHSRTRNGLLEILQANRLPLTELELRGILAKAGFRVNKTTVYRELKNLKDNGFIREVGFGDNRKRFELVRGGHHHHLVCVNCSRIDEIEVRDEVARLEKKINRKINRSKSFKITGHSLEFFGLCKACK